ncbi:MAG: alginate export family protein [candidate division Zixibacteria bacterium]|nr:alginate export family protein [candidate division Zixibacteria bacterium]
MNKSLRIFAFCGGLLFTAPAFAEDYGDKERDKASVEFEVDGSVRYRFENWNQHPFLWGDNDLLVSAFPGLYINLPEIFNHNYTNLQTLRSQVGIKARLTDDKYAYVQFQDARYFGMDALNWYRGDIGQTPELHNFNSTDQFGVTQAFFNVTKLWETPLGIKIGRQYLSYDSERMVGKDDWSLYGQSFDAIKIMYRQDKFDGDVFYSQFSPFYPLDNVFPNINFFGFHGTAKINENLNWSAYLFGYRDGETPTALGSADPFEEIADGDPDAKTLLWTLGSHVKGELGDKVKVSYNGEAAFQFGDWYGFDASGLMLAGGAKVQFSDMATKPYFGANFTYASGDDSADGDKSTFVRLFPSPHRDLGKLDIVGMQNVFNFELNGGISPTPKLDLKAAFNLFWLNETRDAWYGGYGQPLDVPGGAFRPGRGVFGSGGQEWGSSSLGQELDFSLRYEYVEGMHVKTGWSHFFMGEAGNNIDYDPAGAPPPTTVDLADVDWFFVQTGLDF